ncbi:hypothetical protein NE237_009455 [Protea cynaroides]|uniref:Dof zinc finger protein n=1 Tax=Protea cynaroides TaxID=273540 RepID=A0A9Q0R0S0_9MAGN|nr:hypothetical protein NE237_009455 [Protea cynaroides]
MRTLTFPSLRLVGGSIRAGSMVDRARLAKLPQPEAALKCPRCESTNTKFCYFNNYSLTQPRHFCKTCRRYWTRGGALRNVPVGGGYRRNKRSKGSRSKSPISSGTTTALPSNSCTSDIIGHIAPPVPPPQLPFMASLHLSDYGTADIGLNFGGIQPPVAATSDGGSGDMEFQIVNNSGGGAAILSAACTDQQWRLQQVQQFPFLTGLYPFEGEGGGGDGGEPPVYGGEGAKQPSGSSGDVTQQQASVKMEENQGLYLSRQFLGIPGNDQYWGGNPWTDFTGFNSSSTTHLL